LKKAFHSTIKLLLIFTIFIGLQGRVIVRYLETLHENQECETGYAGIATIKAAVVYCNLQCYARDFKVLDKPGAAFLSTFIIPVLVSERAVLFLKEKSSSLSLPRLSLLRAPPVL
jgi:hypothetical protein